MRLAWRNPERQRIEAIDSFAKKPAPLDVSLARLVGIGIIKAAWVPAVGRNLGNRIDGATQHVPERPRVRCSARETAADADDRDRLGRRVSRRRLLRFNRHQKCSWRRYPCRPSEPRFPMIAPITSRTGSQELGCFDELRASPRGRIASGPRGMKAILLQLECGPDTTRPMGLLITTPWGYSCKDLRTSVQYRTVARLPWECKHRFRGQVGNLQKPRGFGRFAIRSAEPVRGEGWLVNAPRPANASGVWEVLSPTVQ